MDAEAIVWLIFIAIWFISGVIQQIKKVATQRPGQEGQPQPGQEGQLQGRQEARGEADRRSRERPQTLPDDDPMVQLLRKLGGEVEVRPQEPPRETRQQPVRPAPPPAPPAPPAQAPAWVGLDRSRPARPAKRPKVAEQAAIPEMKLPPIVPTVSKGGGPATALARSIQRDLRRPDSVRKAILLQEILGKPPGLQGLRR